MALHPLLGLYFPAVLSLVLQLFRHALFRHAVDHRCFDPPPSPAVLSPDLWRVPRPVDHLQYCFPDLTSLTLHRHQPKVCVIMRISKVVILLSNRPEERLHFTHFCALGHRLDLALLYGTLLLLLRRRGLRYLRWWRQLLR